MLNFIAHPEFLILECRVVLPPVYPGGFSDTFPGPGAGYFPSRSGLSSCIFPALLPLAGFSMFICKFPFWPCRGGFGGDGSMLVGW